MASITGFVHRNWLIMNPPAVKKNEDALKFGILGAASIAPMSLIKPAKNHPDVVIQCVAARDEKKAKDYAKKHGIPEVKKTYQDILDDPSINCVYIPLPNGLHYEWALKSLAAGKHVLLEKPSVSNSSEAKSLFHNPLLTNSSPSTGTKLVLLEAFHFRFQPPWNRFLSLLQPTQIATARAQLFVPAFAFGKDDIRFNYGLSGGSLMDLGTYPIAALRGVFAAEPEECLEAHLKTMEPPREKADVGFKAKFRFPGGGVGEVEGSLGAAVTELGMPRVSVVHKPVVVVAAAVGLRGEEGEGGEGGGMVNKIKKGGVMVEDVKENEELVKTRKVEMTNFLIGAVWHKITVEDSFVLRGKEDKMPVKSWSEKRTVKAYTWAEGKVDLDGTSNSTMDLDLENQSDESYWITYRHQLEQFVEHVRGRKGTGVWVDGEDSVAQMRAIDMVYEKSGLPLRPTSEFQL